MNIIKCTKESFSVIGKEGSTRQGEGFIQRLWEDANSHFGEVQTLAKVNRQGELMGIWGAMTSFDRSFSPWEEDFTQGLYLAGVECREEAEPPAGWTKWTVPGFEYVAAEAEGPETFSRMIAYLEGEGISLAGAVQDFTCPKTGKSYMYFPIKKL